MSEIVSRNEKGVPGYDRITTNADKIRSMSDEELSELLNDSISIFNCDMCDIRPYQGSCNTSSDECKNATLRWLQNEVSNGN